MVAIVVTDANVLINLLVAGVPELLARLPGHEFVVTDEVVAEVTRPDQAAALALASQEGWLRRESLADLVGLRLYTDLRTIMGRGEAASLALAESRGWWIASDERRAFLREARARLGAGRILNTPGVLVLAIRAGVLTVERADEVKAVLESRRFRMRFASFRDVI